MPTVSPLHEGTDGPPEKGVSPTLSSSPDRSQCRVSRIGQRTQQHGTGGNTPFRAHTHLAVLLAAAPKHCTTLAFPAGNKALGPAEALLVSALTGFFQTHSQGEGAVQVASQRSGRWLGPWLPDSPQSFPLMYLITCYNRLF